MNEEHQEDGASLTDQHLKSVDYDVGNGHFLMYRFQNSSSLKVFKIYKTTFARVKKSKKNSAWYLLECRVGLFGRKYTNSIGICVFLYRSFLDIPCPDDHTICVFCKFCLA